MTPFDVIAHCVDDGAGGLVVKKCPFCGKPHYHGLPANYRLSHCLKNPRMYLLIQNGEGYT